MSEEPQQHPPQQHLTETKKKRPSVPEIPDILKVEAPAPTRKKRPFTAPMAKVGALAGIGVEIFASILGLGGVGWLLDYWFGTFPIMMTIGLILGIIGGLYNAVKKAMRVNNSSGYEYHYKRKNNSTKK